jgi:DNA-binding winged helix-turn-helix (wHTH) protein
VNERPSFTEEVLKGGTINGLRAATSVETPPDRTIAFGPFSFDRTSRLLWKAGVEVPLPPRVLGVLALLVERPGDVVTKQELMAAVWRDAFVTETSLSEAISVLRQTLGDDPQRPTYIQTLHRRGYRFVAETRGVTPQLVVADASVTSARLVPSREAADPSLETITAWAIALLSLLTAASAVWQYLKVAEPAPRQAVRFALSLPDGLTMAAGDASLAVSNDGSLIALAACRGSDCGIYLRPLSQVEPILVAGTAGGAAPFFAPDGRSIGYFANGRLYSVSLAGGSPVGLADAPDPLGATWLDDGRIVFARSAKEGLFVVADTGGSVQPITEPGAGELGHRWPAAVPGDPVVIFTVEASRSYAGALSVRTRRWSRLLDDVTGARVPLPGYLIAQRGRDLIAGAVGADSRSMAGLPIPVAALDSTSAHFAMSAAGTLAIASPGSQVVHVVLDWAGELRRLVPAPRPAIRR